MAKSRAELVALLAERRRTDPLLAFTPSPVQHAFLHSTSPFRFISGGNRTGKTTINVIDLAMCMRNLHPVRKCTKFNRYLVLTNTRQQAAQVFGRKLLEACELPGPLCGKPLIPPEELTDVSYLKVGLRVPYFAKTKFAEVIFSWSGVDDIWERLQGLELDQVYLDEDAGTNKLLDELFMRGLSARSSGIPWAGGINWSMTPTCGSSAAVRFRQYCRDHRPTESHFFIPAGENPSISLAALDEARGFLGKQAAVRVEGTKDATDLVLIYGEQWADHRHMRATDYVPSPEDNLWLSYDPGVEHPTGMFLAAISKDAPTTLRHVKFWNHSRQTLDYDVDQLDRFLLGRRLAGLVYDTAAKNTDKMGTSVIRQMTERLIARNMLPICGLYQAQKQHYHGITLVRHYLSPDPLDNTIAPLIEFSPSQESGGQLIREQFLKYRGKEETRFTGEGGVIKKDDEAPDCVRYLVAKRPAYNPDWACGGPTRFAPAPEVRIEPIPVAPPQAAPAPYHLHLSRSRARGRSDRWIEAEL